MNFKIGRAVRILSAPPNFTYNSSGWSMTSSTFNASASFVAVGNLPMLTNGCAVPFVWSGLYQGGPQPITANSSATFYTFEYKINGGATQTRTINLPVTTCDLTFSSSPADPSIHKSFAPVEMSWDLESGVTFSDPVEPPPVLNNLAKFEGKDLAIPYYVEGSAESVSIVIGGQTLTFPVDHSLGGSGGVAMLNLPIPVGWDGTATINGQVIALAPRIAYTGSPTMETYANPYKEPNELPQGMTLGVLPLPAGMTAQSWYGLPAGVSIATKLALPAGVTAITDTRTIAGQLPIGVTRTDGSKTWTTSATGTSHTVTTSVPSGSVQGSDVPVGEATSDAILDAGLGAAGSDVKPSVGLAGYGNRWDDLKQAIDGKFGDFQVLNSGEIPKASLFSMTLNLGIMGVHHVELDLTAEPFVTARALALAFVSYYAAMWFIGFIKV